MERAARARRLAIAVDATAAGRKPAARRIGRARRHADRALGQPAAGRATVDAGQHGVPRSLARSSRAGVHDGRHDRDRAAVRDGTGISCRRHCADRGVEGARARRGERRPREHRQHSRRRAGGALARAGRRRGLVHADVFFARRPAPRLRQRPRHRRHRQRAADRHPRGGPASGVRTHSTARRRGARRRRGGRLGGDASERHALEQPRDRVGGTQLPERQSVSNFNAITPGWLTTFGTPVLAGRDVTPADRKGSPLVVLVNQAFAKRFLNGDNPVGRTVSLSAGNPSAEAPREIVGLVSDAVYRSLREPVPPTMYVPLAQFDDSRRPAPANMSISVRPQSGSPAALARAVAAAISDVDRDLALTFRPLADQVNASLTQERLVALLSGFFGGLALLLAGLGLYGVTSYAVTRRQTEIGIRMALGAAPGGVVRLVLARVTLLVGIGVAVGAGLSVWAAKFVATLLYGLQPRDPATIVASAAVLAAVGALAGWVPAYRASRIDPAQVLRDS